MTIEIHELIIEARVVDDSLPAPDGSPGNAVTPWLNDDALMERIARRVLEMLNEQKERL
ncbi:DUF5908 family protein [Chromobacterium haemolyticum]|uniref:DUF5908 family protein n=1 Tax=Chromobacterium haemolyticum TaxID=394935 RepID=UPI00244CD4A0|nr:DUF5908 family protein [Chromobacterium haemolyticum]MDH0342422.1 DUF5908 family protein [Chromobacterium haemolyticum]